MQPPALCFAQHKQNSQEVQFGKISVAIKHKGSKGTKLRVLCVLSVAGVENRAEKKLMDNGCVVSEQQTAQRGKAATKYLSNE
jgi:hypothetical protein